MTGRRPRVLIRGAGLAGIAAARLLRDRGAEVLMSAPPRAAGRIVAIPIETLALAQTLFDVDIAMLQIGPMVEGRRVDWSADGTAVVPQIALACDVGDFAAALARPLRKAGCMVGGTADDDADWIIEASGRPVGSTALGGERVGQFVRVANTKFEAMTTITATPHGWIFTAPHPGGDLVALMVMPSAASAASTPDEVAERLAFVGLKVTPADIVAIDRPEPVAPRLSVPLIVANRLRVGDAALALDPLRGDGAGFALRGALLAQAVLAAVDGGRERTQCFGHYEQRLRVVFLSHLKGCSAHYRAARHAAIWKRDVAAMDRLAAQLDLGEKVPNFRLEGLHLTYFAPRSGSLCCPGTERPAAH
jgi:flavin-dependent dehydrogenase